MRTSLNARFAAVRDVRPVADPWGLGVVFEVVRDGAERLRRWRESVRDSNPITLAVIEASARAQFVRAATGDKGKAADVLERAAEAVRIGPEDLRRSVELELEEAVERIAGWSGLTSETGEPLEYSREVAAELVRSTEWIADGLPYGGQELGPALRAWLRDESTAAEAYRDAVLEEARGN